MNILINVKCPECGHEFKMEKKKNLEKKTRSNKKDEVVKIETLTPKTRNVTIIGKIIEINEPREVTIKRQGRMARVGDFLIADDTGCINLTLWDENLQKVTGCNVVKITMAYVNEYEGSMRLNMSRYSDLTELTDKTEEYFEEVNIENNLSSEFYGI